MHIEKCPSAPAESSVRKLARVLILLAGILIGQAILYGPSLAGRKILLPLDILTVPRCLIPQSPGHPAIQPHNRHLEDLVDLFEPARHSAASELRAGRLPMWMPSRFAGAPFIWPKFSPFALLACSSLSPVAIAWAQLALAITAGLGAYAFCRHVLNVGFWPAAIAGWCYPVTAFFILWQGYPTSPPVSLLPWLLLAVDKTIRRPTALAPPALAVVTALVLTSGQLDVAGEVLLASGLFALWCLRDAYGAQWFKVPARKGALALVLAWGIGFSLAAPAILPVMEYAKTGARMMQRSVGKEERPPVGLPALPQVVLPRMYGSVESGSFAIFPKGQGNLTESTAATYTGVLATLFLAPLAWCSRRHRSSNVFLTLLILLGLSWSLNVPGLVSLWRLPGLNMMSFNRFVFASAFALLALTAVGLDVLQQGRPPWRWWFWLPTAALAGLCAWCVYRVIVLPDYIATGLPATIRKGQPTGWVNDLAGVEKVQDWFAASSLGAAALCGLGLAAWFFLKGRTPWRPWFVPLMGILLLTDLLLLGYGRSPQCDPALYYPRVPLLEEIKQSIPGRIIGYNCLPANLAEMCGLRDVRGYDGVDPARLMDVLFLGADPRSKIAPYARTQLMAPKLQGSSAADLRLPPVFDMLGVRYVVFRDPVEPNITPTLRGPDYWILVNSNALPRAYIPERVELVNDPTNRLHKLGSPSFNPAKIAFVETPVDLPDACRGTAEIVEEIPTRIKVALNMKTPGLVVLADLWDKGWRAYLDGKPVPILRANHAIRGVVVPSGAASLEFRYEPASFAWGLRLAALALLALVAWGAALQLRRRADIPVRSNIRTPEGIEDRSGHAIRIATRQGSDNNPPP